MSPKIAAAAAALVVAAIGGAALWAWGVAEGDRFAACREGGSTAGAAIGGPFTLTDAATGARVTDAELIDRPTFIYFGYTYCPDFCPIDGAAMAGALDLLEARGIAANAAFVTIDPERDTPEALAAFTAALHPRLRGLRGDADETAAAARAFRVYYARSGDDPEHYLMDHSTFTYLMAPGVGFLDFFRHGAAPEEIAERTACYVEAMG